MVLLMPRLSKCCCCIPLRIASLIIGYFSLIISIFLISLVCGSLYKLVKYVGEHKNDPDSGFTTEEIQSAAIRLYIAHTFFILVFVISCIINMMLIFGVQWKILRLVGYYVTASMVLLVLQFILVVLIFVFMGLLAALPVFTWCIILFFFIIVVRSAYLDMEDRKKLLVSVIYDTSTLRGGQMEQPLMSSSSSSRPYPSYMKFEYHSVQ